MLRAPRVRPPGAARDRWPGPGAAASVVLLAAGNAELYERARVVSRPVTGLSPSVLALAWRRSDTRPVVAAFVRAVDEQL